MTKISQTIKIARNDFMTGKFRGHYIVAYLMAVIIFGCFFVLGSLILYIMNLKVLSYTFSVLGDAFLLIATLVQPIFKYTLYPIGMWVTIKLFAKYGNILNRKEWRNMRKNEKILFKVLRSKRSDGLCYACVWETAMFLKDVQIVFLGANSSNDNKTGHAVVLKNGCVYDTTLKVHFDYQEYLERFGAKVYKIFTYDEYNYPSYVSFASSVKKDWEAWCKVNNVRCFFKF